MLFRLCCYFLHVFLFLGSFGLISPYFAKAIVVDISAGKEKPVSIGIHFVINKDSKDSAKMYDLMDSMQPILLSDLRYIKLFDVSLNQRDVFDCNVEQNQHCRVDVASRTGKEYFVFVYIDDFSDSLQSYRIRAEVWNTSKKKIVRNVKYYFNSDTEHIRKTSHSVSDDIMLGVFNRKAFFDSKFLYIADWSNVGCKDYCKQIGLRDRDGANNLFLTNRQMIMSPVYLPKIGRINFISYAKGFAEVKTLDISKGTISSLIRDLELGQLLKKSIVSQDVSPDGRFILFSVVELGNTNLYRYDIKTSKLKRLFAGRANVSPSFSPNGKEFVFSSDRSGPAMLYISDINGEKTKRITSSKGMHTEPKWSPDGKKVVYTKVSRGRFSICVVFLDTGKEKELFSSYLAERPNWSPSGMEIVFSSKEFANDTESMRIINMDGVELQTITNKYNSIDPYWFVA